MAGFFAKGLAATTQRSYQSAQKRYLKYCLERGFNPLPTTELILCRFVAYLAHQGLKQRTLKSYLSAIRHLHIAEGLEDPFKAPLHRLHYTLSGVIKTESERAGSKRVRLPITPPILRQMKTYWNKTALDSDTLMLWAACCLGFFGFLRSAEMTVPSDSSFDPTVHLSYKDIAVDNPSSPSIVQVTIKQSKTDPFRKGISLFLGKTSTDLCPVTWHTFS